MKLSDKEKQLRLKLSAVLPVLNEKQRRILIASTKTKSGLTVKARLDKKKYKKGIKVTKREIESLNIKRNNFHGEWNYTIKPR